MRDDRPDDPAGITRLRFIKGATATGFALGAGGLLAACGDDDDASSSSGDTGKSGGTLRLGTSGGSAKDKLEPQFAQSAAQQARQMQLYEGLMRYDADFKVVPWLAEELTAESPTRWIVRLREGLVFHDGSPVEAEDVIFSLRRILEPKEARSGRAGLGTLDSKRMRARDKRTVELVLTAGTRHLPDLLAEYYNTIVPRGFDIAKPVGTGPFTLQSHNPGRESRFDRFDDYWNGKALVDSIVISDLVDSDARTNALISGQVDLIDYVPFSQAEAIEKQGGVITDVPSGSWLPIVMRCNEGPLADARVRRALKLLADRRQFVESVVAGHGSEAYDLYSPFDSLYADDLAKRDQDVEQAKSLLRSAGRSDLGFTITTADAVAGMNDTAQVFAEQAKSGGVKVNVRKTDVATLYGSSFIKWVANTDVWGTRNYLSQVSVGSLPDAPFNSAFWKNTKFVTLYRQAAAELDDAKCAEITHEMQQIEQNEGPYIIPMFPNQVGAHGSKVGGIKATRSQLPLSTYDFRRVTVQ